MRWGRPVTWASRMRGADARGRLAVWLAAATLAIYWGLVGASFLLRAISDPSADVTDAVLTRLGWGAYPTVGAVIVAHRPRNPVGRLCCAVGLLLGVHGAAGALFSMLQAAAAVLLPVTILAAASMVVRFRRARGEERQQLKWFTFAAVLSVTVWLAFIVTGRAERLPIALGIVIALLWLVAVPLAIGVAMLRHRLYDIDRLINRTLVYGLLTALLGGIYAAVVLALGQVLGRASNLAVAVATLTVATAFQPARRRIQEAVDRRFNRRRYDSARTIAAFSARLRQQLDLEPLTTELLVVVDQTMEPTSITLWLRPPRTG